MSKRRDDGAGGRREPDAHAPSKAAARADAQRGPGAGGEQQADQPVLLGSAGTPAVGGRDSARTAEATRQTGG